MIKVFLVEDEMDTAFLLGELLTNASDINYLGFADNGKSAIEKISLLKTDVVLMDIGLPDMSGIDCVKALKPNFPQIEFVMCTAIESDENVFNALLQGASSYVAKHNVSSELLDTVRGVAVGESPMCSDIARSLIKMLQNSRKPVPSLKVTKKQHELLQLLAKGHSYIEIAEKANITVKTLKGHIYRLYIRLKVDNRTEAINKYYGRESD